MPIVAGGTGLYLRALIDGLFPAPPQRPGAARAAASACRKARRWRICIAFLTRLDAKAAAGNPSQRCPQSDPCHRRSRSLAEAPMTEQWKKGRDRLDRLQHSPARAESARARLYERINQRAAAMFDRGLVEETARLIERYGRECRALRLTGLRPGRSSAARRDVTREKPLPRPSRGIATTRSGS